MSVNYKEVFILKAKIFKENKRIKIFIILGGLGVEGISTIALSYLEQIEKKEFDFSLIVAGPCDKNMLKKAQSINIPIIKLSYRKSEPKKYFWELYNLLKSSMPDIIHIHGNSATMALDLLIARIAGVHIRIPHCHNTKCDNEHINKLLQPLLYFSMTEGFACGEDAGKWLYKNREYKIIKNGRKLSDYMFNLEVRTKYRNKLMLEDETLAIGHVGTFTEQKNQAYLIQVLNTLKNSDIKLFLFGDGPLKEECIKLTKEYRLDDKVIFMGNVNKIGLYLNAMDIMCLPSRYEGLPLVTIEWQINGLPCIISKNVTDECKIMENIVFEDISDDSINNWAKVIDSRLLNRISNKNDIYKQITLHGFNIEENSRWLAEEYKNLYAKKVKRRRL